MTLDRLAGAWRLKAFDFADAEGGLIHPLGETPQGAVVVTPDGYFVLSFVAPDRPLFADDNPFGGTMEERAAAAAGYVAFGGPCTVTDDTITVQVEVALYPNWIGRTQVRTYEIDGNRLTLRTTGAWLLDGVERTGRAELERA